jgi:lipoyl-dependent peroxiredoxin
MATRSAQTTWSGGLQDGSGSVSLTSSGVATFDVSFPRRAADEAEGVTSPEELIAAAHSSCFAMQFSAMLGEAGGSNIALTVDAVVSLGPDPAGGFRIPRIALAVSGSADGVDADTFAKVAEQAKASCPVSKALAGPEISLTVR